MGAGEAALEVTRLVERALRDSRAVDLEALCVLAGQKVCRWDEACACVVRDVLQLPELAVEVGISERGVTQYATTLSTCSETSLVLYLHAARNCFRGSAMMVYACPYLHGPSSQVWAVRADVHVLDHCGNVADACVLSALAGLLAFRRPDVTVGGADGVQVTRRCTVAPHWPSHDCGAVAIRILVSRTSAQS